MSRATCITVGTFLLLAVCVAAPVCAYPDKPIRMIVPFPPGGGGDIVARVVAQKFIERWSQQVIVDNRAGANGNIASQIIARAAPDGYTLYMASAGPITINPSLYEGLGFDPARDLAPVALAAPVYYVLVAHPAAGIARLTELVDLAKARPGKVTFASAGVGSPGHLAGEMLGMMANVKLLHVPYKGTGPALSDLLGGQVNTMFSDMTATIDLIRSSKLKALLVGSPARDPRMPELPTAMESGLAGFVAVNWIGLLGPAGMPRVIIDQLNSEVNRIIKLPEVQQRFASDGRAFGANTPQEFRTFILADVERWRKVIKAAGVRAE